MECSVFCKIKLKFAKITKNYNEGWWEEHDMWFYVELFMRIWILCWVIYEDTDSMLIGLWGYGFCVDWFVRIWILCWLVCNFCNSKYWLEVILAKNNFFSCLCFCFTVQKQILLSVNTPFNFGQTWQKPHISTSM